MNHPADDTLAALNAALDVLSPTEIDKARHAAQTACNWLSGSRAMQAEMAATTLALILNDMGNTSRRPDLTDVLPAVEALAMYVIGRMPIIVRELGDADADDNR
jgi:hypothetical protein